MRVPRIYLDAPLDGSHVQLDERAFQHAIKVLRLREGQDIILFNGDGRDYLAKLDDVQKKQARAQLHEATINNSESELYLHLALGISKGERMDIAIQKAVELGVAEITPLYTERCVVNLDSKRESKRLEHWHGVIISACEQCGRSKLPLLNSPLDLRHQFDSLPSCDLRLTLSPYASQHAGQLAPPSGSALVLVGPEGGLSEHEVETAMKHGFQAIRMGPRILRTETAAITAIAMLQILWGDLG